MRVLVPIDGSDPARQAFDHAIENFPEAAITLLHVIDIPDPSIHIDEEKLIESRREEAEGYFEQVTADIDTDQLTLSTDITVGDPSNDIVEYVEDTDIDQVIIGSHGRKGVSRVFLGSVAEKVVRRCPVPVTVIH